jgi:2-haloacid dehalogenase
MALPVKACFFDMFGTMLDWRNSVARETRAILEPLGHKIDWLAFADAWRAEYRPSMNEVNDGKRPYVKLDVLHRENLEKILPRYGVKNLDAATIHNINMGWHRLDAWPDVPPGLNRLKTKFKIAPLSNGNVSLMADVARRNGYCFDAILGSEFARVYKMLPPPYLMSCAAFDLAPSESLMCAAHILDLKSAAALGMRTAFIHRPDEYGPGKGEPRPKEGVDVDLVVGSAVELAERLGA